jgi:hypothetical protein
MSEIDRQDYAELLDEWGINDAYVRRDMAFFPVVDLDDPNVYTGPSDIQGTGLFVSHVKAGTEIKAAADGVKTIAGRYTNHSPNPNARMDPRGNEVMLVTLRELNDEEVTIDYRDTPVGKVLRGSDNAR